MTMTFEKLTRDTERKAAPRSKRLRNAIAMQEIEGNPLTVEEIATFEDFEARGLSHEKRRAELNEKLSKELGIPSLFR